MHVVLRRSAVARFPDRAFRLLLSQPANLREVVEHVAPALVAKFDFEHSRQLDRELPLPDWRRREADLLFLVPFQETKEKSALVCVLLEHQSRQDPSMPLRTLLYAVLFWEREWRAWEEKHERGQALRLTPVLPIVLHAGGKPWDTHRTLADLIDAPEALRIYLPSWQPLFWDLSVQTSEDLLHFVGALHNALAIVRAENDEAQEFQELYEALLVRLEMLREREKMRRNDLMWFVISWAIRRRPKAEAQKLLAAALAQFQKNPALYEEVRGMVQQVEKSWADEMKEEGVVAGMQRSLRTNLEERFGTLPEALARQIAAISDAERIQAAIRQSLHIQSLDELKL